jgi:hypothetical protein
MSKTYFLAPTRDTPPNGPITLGSIIKSPRSPELSLNERDSPAVKALKVGETSVTSASRTLLKSGKGKAGVWAEFIDGVGISGKISGNWDNGELAQYKFEKLITKTIAPDLVAVSKIFEEASVQKAIKDSRFRANLYMITGIKVARGADVAISKIRARGGNLYFGVDTTALALPLKIGPDISATTTAGQSLTEHHSTDFVFAYRLRELVYKRKVIEEQKEYPKGDLMGHNEGMGEMGDNEDFPVEAEVSGLDPEDLKAEDWELEPIAATDDDGEDCVCVAIDGDDDD